MPGDKWTTKSYGCQLKKVYVKNLNTNEKTEIKVYNVSKTGLTVSATIVAGVATAGVTPALGLAFGSGITALSIGKTADVKKFYKDFNFIAYGSTHWKYKISDNCKFVQQT